MQIEIRKYSSVESTNITSREFLDQINQDSIIVVMADKQLAGKGYGNNIWESEPGKNMMASLIIKPDFLSATDQFIISMIVSLSLFDSVADIIGRAGLKIKWPNDLYYYDSKLAGILIENSITGSYITNSIIGIGLNVNQKSFSRNVPNPTSIISITGEEINVDNFIKDFLNNFVLYYSILREGKVDELKSSYLEKLYKLNQTSLFSDTSSGEFYGEITGVGEFGKLQITTKDGLKEYGFKEVEYSSIQVK